MSELGTILQVEPGVFVVALGRSVGTIDAYRAGWHGEALTGRVRWQRRQAHMFGVHHAQRFHDGQAKPRDSNRIVDFGPVIPLSLRFYDSATEAAYLSQKLWAPVVATHPYVVQDAGPPLLEVDSPGQVDLSDVRPAPLTSEQVDAAFRRAYHLHVLYANECGATFDEHLWFFPKDEADLFELLTTHYDREELSPRIFRGPNLIPRGLAGVPQSFTNPQGNDCLDLFYRWQAETPV
jgi:hypothetical protein